MIQDKTRSNIGIIAGGLIIAVATILVVSVLSNTLELQLLASTFLLAFVRVAEIFFSVSGLSEGNAMWFGGIIIGMLYLIGGCIVVKNQKFFKINST